MRRIALLSLVAGLVACTSAGSAPTRAITSEGSNLLFFATPLGVTVFDAHEHQPRASVPGGILAPDRSAVFGALPDGDATVLQRYDPGSGDALRVATVHGTHELRVANHDGSLVVFGPPRHASGVDYPVGRAITTLTIVKTDGVSRTLDIIGNVEPEAFSNDDTNLFVVQYLPPQNPVGYQVRRLDLSTGELHNVRTDDSDLDKPMAGRACTQVLSPDGTRLYTLYVVAGDGSGTPGYAFVHVLDLVGKQAFCLDLPTPFGTVGAAAYAIAVSRDGQRLHVADPNMGVLTELDTGSLAVTRTVSIPATHPPTAFAAVDSEGRLILGAGRDLLVFAPDLSTIESSWLLDGSAAAVMTTSFDRNVYVAVNNTIDVFDGNNIDKGPLTTTRVPGAPGLIAADPVPSVDYRGPIECAC